MPNKPRPDNPARPVRVDDELWCAALETARANNTTVSAVVRQALTRYVQRHGNYQKPPPKPPRK